MLRHVSLVFVGVAALLGQAKAQTEPAPAQLPSQPQAETTTTLQGTLEKVAAQTRPEVSIYYSRAIAPEDYSDFHQYMGVDLELGYVIDPSLIAEANISLDRELGAPIEAFRATNTTLSLKKLVDLPNDIGLLRPMIYARLPTNDEDRYYLSYRGTFGTGVSLVNDDVFTFRGRTHAIGGGVSLSGARNFFGFTHSREGAMANRLWALTGTAQLIYTLYDKLSFIASFRNSFYWTYEGQDNDRYELTGAIQYLAPYGIRLSLKTVTSDRTFQYDQVTANVRLYKPENTLVLFSVGYAPVYETVTQ